MELTAVNNPQVKAAAELKLKKHRQQRGLFLAEGLRTVEEAVASLAQAKAMHDDLEAIYHPYVDFSLVDRTAQELAQTILEK